MATGADSGQPGAQAPGDTDAAFAEEALEGAVAVDAAEFAEEAETPEAAMAVDVTEDAAFAEVAEAPKATDAAEAAELAEELQEAAAEAAEATEEFAEELQKATDAAEAVGSAEAAGFVDEAEGAEFAEELQKARDAAEVSGFAEEAEAAAEAADFAEELQEAAEAAEIAEEAQAPESAGMVTTAEPPGAPAAGSGRRGRPAPAGGRNLCEEDEELHIHLCYKRCDLLTDGEYPYRTTAWSCCKEKRCDFLNQKGQKVDLRPCLGLDVAGDSRTPDGAGKRCPFAVGKCNEDEVQHHGLCVKAGSGSLVGHQKVRLPAADLGTSRTT